MSLIRKPTTFLLYDRVKQGLLTIRRKFKTAVKLVLDGRLRSETFYRKIHSHYHHQNSTYTITNRYPLLFSACTRYFLNFKNNPAPKILSFGCSTGEEVFTLGEYMPLATIIGIDANHWCINQCHKKNHKEKYFFYNRKSKKFTESKDYDAIFCMAVLQNSINRISTDNNIAVHYTFSKFEKEVSILHQKLKVGGLFIIDETDFSFTDFKYAHQYEPLPFDNNQIIKNRPLFDKNNRKISDSQLNNRIFVKVK